MRFWLILFSILFLFSGCSLVAEDECSESKVPAVSTTVEKPVFDDVFGVSVDRSTSWYVDGGKIYKNCKEVSFKGINWFGFETRDLMLHGVWTGRTVDEFLKQARSLGFNAMRLPVSPEAMSMLPSSWGLPTANENFRNVLDKLRDNGFYVLLDLHNCNYQSGFQVGDPSGCSGYTREDWYSTLRQLAYVSKEYENIWGIDLFNEPHKLSWREWRDASNRATQEILTINPKILSVVEGVNSFNTENGGYWTYWGENLTEASRLPVAGPKSRIVYSPHVYGPSVAWQQYFSDPTFPKNMEKIWDVHFGYMIEKGYPIFIGEWGGRYTEVDKIWQDAFVDYLIKRGIKSWYYWSWNANSGDTGGVLLDDWKTVNENKMKLLRRIM